MTPIASQFPPSLSHYTSPLTSLFPHCLLEIVQGLCDTSATTMKIRVHSMHKF